jgi:hypothetical protein
MRLLRYSTLLLALLGSSFAAGQCGGTERWAVKDGTDPKAQQIDLQNPVDINIPDLLTLPEPQRPPQGDNTIRIVPNEMHLYRVQARLVQWRKEAGETGDSDYHLVLADSTLNFTPGRKKPTGHSFVGEIPDPDCLAGAGGEFGASSPFLPSDPNASLSIRAARQALENQFPDADLQGGWNDAGGIPVEVMGIGFFDFPHGQVGRAPNDLEIHPILSITFPGQPEFATTHNPPAVAAASTHTTARTQPATGPQTATGLWEYTIVTAPTAEQLLTSANALGKEGWEMVGVAMDTNRRDRYVGYLKRPHR